MNKFLNRNTVMILTVCICIGIVLFVIINTAIDLYTNGIVKQIILTMFG